MHGNGIKVFFALSYQGSQKSKIREETPLVPSTEEKAWQLDRWLDFLSAFNQYEQRK